MASEQKNRDLQNVERSAPMQNGIQECTNDDAGDSGPIDFLKDSPKHMTFGRRIALYLASKSTWYNPHLGKTHGPNGEQIPSLAKAWAYFEHITLERYVVQDQTRLSNLTARQRLVKKFHRGDRQLNIAEPGERDLPTKLYNPITTPLSQLGDFGLGYGLYFSTLRSFAVLSFVIGLLNLPIILYYGSDEYSQGQNAIAPTLRWSAICTDQPWVACPDCPSDYSYQRGTFSRWRTVNILNSVQNSTGEWLNVTDLLDWSVVNPNITKDELYLPGEGVFTQEVLNALEVEYGIVVKSDYIWVNGYYDLPCPEPNSCLATYCECQVLSRQDCYCKVGNLPFANTTVYQLSFAQKNNCNGATTQNGYINMASVFLLILGTLFIRTRQDGLEVKFDEDEQTAQDYSICISNPPPDAFDPEEWKEFFENTFDCQVSVCTVDVDNDHMVQLLVKRREILQNLRGLLPGVELSHRYMQKLATEKKAWCCRRSAIGKLSQEYTSVVAAIQEEVSAGHVHPTATVFVTFETEAGQREVLEKLSVGWYAAQRNNTSVFKDARHLFRGKYVLDVSEPEEPSAIRWQEMNSTRYQIVGGLLFTSFASLVMLVIAYTVIIFLYPVLPFLAPLVVTLFTSIFPIIAKALMDFERHRSESSRQKWLFIKIATFNIMITAVLISVVNPFTSSIDQRQGSVTGLIPVVHATFISQLGLSPVLQILDIGGNLSRHFFAPRAKSQEAMNRNFGGTQVYLAERYANLMKYLFLIAWYCVLYPTAFFMGALALLIVYFVDRFSLMRSWARTPQLGTQISDFARNYFTPVAIALMAVSSAYTWSGFPFDNLCPMESATLDDSYVGDWYLYRNGREFQAFGYTIFRSPDVDENVTMTQDAQVYQYCLQDFRAYLDSRSFPPLPKFQIDQWMTMEQEDLLNVYGWVAVGVLAAVIAFFLIRTLYKVVEGMVGSYAPRGEDMGIPFSEINTIDTYIPSCPAQFGYPYLLCDVTSIDPTLFSWTDPDRPHKYYDVTQDLIEIFGEADFDTQHLFARVKHWPHENKRQGTTYR